MAPGMRAENCPNCKKIEQNRQTKIVSGTNMKGKMIVSIECLTCGFKGAGLEAPFTIEIENFTDPATALWNKSVDHELEIRIQDL